MKNKSIYRSLLVFSVLLATRTVHAQTNQTYSANGYTLSLGNYYSFSLGFSHTYMGLNMRPINSGWSLGTDGANNGGALITGNIGGSMNFFTIPTANGANSQTFTDTQVMNFSRMEINSAGQVRIGVQMPRSPHADYRLSVDGKLVAKSLYILANNTTNWADYVFAEDYKLPSLEELDAYIKRYKHLPEVPTTAEVEAKGINVAQINTLLLKKVEELTLQLIALDKKVNNLQDKKAQLLNNK